MGLACIMFLLESIHALIKFAQACDTFVRDFVTERNMVQNSSKHFGPT